MDSGAKVDVQFVQGWWEDTGRPEDLLEANQLVLQELQPLNEGVIENGATVAGSVKIGKDTVIHGRTTIGGPVILGEHSQVGPNVYIGPYTSMGSNVTIRNSEVENSIVMDGGQIECGKRIIDSLIGMKAKVVCSKDSVPKGTKLILGDMTYISI